MNRRADSFQTIHSEGGLLPPYLLRRIAEPKEKIPGTTPEEYGLPQGDRINEAITQSWNRLRRHWAEFSEAMRSLPSGEPATGLTNDRWNLPLVRELGFGLLPTTTGPEIMGRTYAINRFFGSVPIHLVGCGLSLDRRAAGVRGAAATNPHGLVQEFLNRAQGYLWGIVSNGLKFRILRDNQALSRQSYLEFDLETMFSGEIFSDFVMLWLVAHATRFTIHDGYHAENCWLEQWTRLAEEQGTRALDSLKEGVEKALEVLGQGFVGHPRNTMLREHLRTGVFSLEDFHGQLLRVIYRLIFLFVTEDRTLEGVSMLHPHDSSDKGRIAREFYVHNYSTNRLRELASHIRGSRHGDLWHQFNLIAGALSGDDSFTKIRDHLALPSLGSFLWSAASTSALNAPSIAGATGTELSNADFLETIRYLGFTRQGKLLRPVDYRNLASEELGGVYESLLTLTPQLSGNGATFTFAEFAGNIRKTTGSYYTPDSLVQCLLDSALDPIVQDAIEGKSGTEAETALLSLKICDPAVGSGHFLVGAAHRMARHLARIRAIAQGESEPSPPIYKGALRDVIGHCLYGVDINPMAAELCKVSLWLEAIEPGKPLSFLDHHIRVGNSLLGATPELIIHGIPDEAFKPIEGDDKKACTELRKRNKAEVKGLGPLFVEHDKEIQTKLAGLVTIIENVPDDRPEDIRYKESKLIEYEQTEEYRHRKFVADTWCSSFMCRKYLGDPTRLSSAKGITQRHLNDLAKGHSLPEELLYEVRSLATEYQFFHWHLAFPDVITKGGFSCVLGNPPWEKIQSEEQSFFAATSTDISNATGAKRKQLIKQLKDTDKNLYASWMLHRRKIEAIDMFIKGSGRYPLTGSGKLNTYAVFAEHALISAKIHGMVGQILPLGIVTDDNTKTYFWDVISKGQLLRLYGFENESLVFPAVHHSFKFCLFTVHKNNKGDGRADLAFYCRSVDDLKDQDRHCVVSGAEISLINPNTNNCPTFHNQRDLEIVRHIYTRVPIIVSDINGSPWSVDLHRVINPTDDSALMIEHPADNPSLEMRGDKENCSLRVYEGKMIHQFDHRFGSYLGQTEAQANQGKLPELSAEEHGNPSIFSQPRHWIPSDIIEPWLSNYTDRKWLLAYRDITSAVVFRTCIAAIIPRVGPVDPCRCIFFSEKASAFESCAFVGGINSFVFDYVARQSVSGTHIAIFVMKQLPVPAPIVFDEMLWSNERVMDWFSARVLELTYTAWDLELFAHDCGYEGPPFIWDEERRLLLRCELDAAYFLLYLGQEDEWRKQPKALTNAFPTTRHAIDYIMETFPLVKRRDEITYGSYRTKEMILEIYDELANCMISGNTYKTRLDPSPGPPLKDNGRFALLPEWLPDMPKPVDWPGHIHPPKGVNLET